MAKPKPRSHPKVTTKAGKKRPRTVCLPDGLPDEPKAIGDAVTKLLARWVEVLELHEDLHETTEKLNAKDWDGTPESRVSTADIHKKDVGEFLAAMLLHLKNRSYEAIDAMLERRRSAWLGGAANALDKLLRYVKPGIYSLSTFKERVEYVRLRCQFVRFDDILLYTQRSGEDVVQAIASDAFLFGDSEKELRGRGVVTSRNLLLANLTHVSLATISRRSPTQEAKMETLVDDAIREMIETVPEAQDFARAQEEQMEAWRLRSIARVRFHAGLGTVVKGPAGKRHR